MAAVHKSSASQSNNKMEQTDANKRTSRNVKNTTLRQFLCCNCGPRGRSWRERVPDKHQESTCRKCKQDYKPVPKGEEWGWASFECICGNPFSGFARMNVKSDCRKCGEWVLPWKLNPPRGQRPRKTSSGHSCSAANCFSKKGTDSTVTCVHPLSGGYFNPSLSIKVKKEDNGANNVNPHSSKAKRSE